MQKLLFFSAFISTMSTGAQTTYTLPPSSAKALAGIPFHSAVRVGTDLTETYKACDLSDCKSDPSENTTIRRFPDKTVFFDAKMGIDADGSHYSAMNACKTVSNSCPDQPETSLRFSDLSSLDAEHIPYIVIPGGSFSKDLGVAKGDVAVVVRGGKVAYAIVGDVGPRKHLGEGSMYLHEKLGHSVCLKKDDQMRCVKVNNASLRSPILYFIFAGSHLELMESGRLKKELTAENLDSRIQQIGSSKFALLNQGAQSSGTAAMPEGTSR